MVAGTVLIAFSAMWTRQVARFEPSQMSRQVALYAPKTSKETAVSTSLAVVAFEVLGPGGIGDAWLAGGLDTAVTMGCASTAPRTCERSTCSTVWLQPEIDGCDILNASHIQAAVATLSPALAVLNVTGATRDLREREYRFQLHMPAFNGSAWHWVSIRGTFDVKAVADPERSDVQLSIQTAFASTPFNGAATLNHLDSLRITILARDVDGNAINRAGEQIVVTIGGTSNTSEVAQYDAAVGQYVVLVRCTTPGDHAIFLFEVQTSKAASRGTFHVVCVAGFTETDQTCVQAANDAEKIVGGTIGAVFLVVLVLALGLLYKNRANALRFALSFFQLEFLLVFKTMAELWDITSDCMRAPKPSVLCEHNQIVSIVSYAWVMVGVRSVHLHNCSQEWTNRRDHRLHCLPPVRDSRFGILVRNERMAVP
jgi:hypothetical protein